jgi:NTP pyrophosphatase (non-canonical NTP hydrolase)
MSIAIEAAELMEHFQWTDADEGQVLLADAEKKLEVTDELADILIYCLAFANQADIDISSAIKSKLDRNEFRFPSIQK